MALTLIITPAVDRALQASEAHAAAWKLHHATLAKWMRVPEAERRMVLDHPLLATGPGVTARRQFEAAGKLVRATRDVLHGATARLNGRECRMYSFARGKQPKCPYCDGAIDPSTYTCVKGCDEPLTY